MFDKPIPYTLDELFKDEEELKKAEAALSERKRKLAEARQAIDSVDPVRKLAVELHRKLCRWNHGDVCAWEYFVKDGQHDWSEHSYAEYARKAAVVMRRLEVNGPVTCENMAEFVNTL